MDAGKLNERLGVLALRETAEGWEWEETGKVWARVELTGKSNLFSRVGIGARDALITIRKRALSLHQALRWEGRHLFLTEITEPDKGWMEIRAALVEPAWCRTADGISFPGVLAVKYLGHTQETPMAVGTGDYVLVTPKGINLKPGRRVEVGATGAGEGRVMLVRTVNDLDPFKNEYELREEFDL